MNKAKEIFLQLLGGIGWVMFAICLWMGGALDSSTGVWLFVTAATVGIGLLYWGLDKLMTPRSRR
jgi:hypothetical protein